MKPKPEEFKIIAVPTNTCEGCWFNDHNIDCTSAEIQSYLNRVFSHYPGNEGGGCRKLIAKRKNNNYVSEKEVALFSEGSY